MLQNIWMHHCKGKGLNLLQNGEIAKKNKAKIDKRCRYRVNLFTFLKILFFCSDCHSISLEYALNRFCT